MDATTNLDDEDVGFSPHEPSTEAIIAAAAKLSPVEYDQQRKAISDKLGIRTSTLDDEVKIIRGEHAEKPQGRVLTLEPTEPWEQPVRLADVLDALANALDRHMVLSTAARDVIALWVAHTWVFDRYQHTPRLGITSPEKRCGKSTLLDVVRAVTCRSLKADNISTASVYRTVEALKPTLLIDEADTHLRDNEELRGVLNSGSEASGMVIRVQEIDGVQQPVGFTTFAPAALAAIGAIPGTLEDRALPVRLQRKTAAQIITKLREPGAREALHDIARQLARWAQDVRHLPCNPDLPAALNDREGDISVPLVSLADAAGEEWPRRGRAALVELFGARAADDDAAGTGTMLLADIRTIFDQSSGTLRIASVRMAELLGAMEERPWAEWRQGKPMTAPQLARALRPFGVRPMTMRIEGSKPEKGYQKDHFADAWARYLSQSPQGGGFNR